MTITKRNLKASKPKANKSIDLKEFIPLASVDPVYFENTHFVGADQGGEKPYRLLADAMEKSGRVAIAELVSRGKEQLVLIRPYPKGFGAAHHITPMKREFSVKCLKSRTKISENELVSCPLNSLHISPMIPGKPALAGATRNPGNRKQNWVS